MYSLPDWAFYPIAALAVTGMVAGALSTGSGPTRPREEILADGILFEGDSLNAITVGNGLSVQVLTQDGETFARIAAVRGPLDGMQSAGAFFTLSPAELEALQGHRVRLRFRMRTADVEGAETAQINFFVDGVGQNTWREVTPGAEFDDVVLEFSPPRCEWAYGYIGLWPDWRPTQNNLDLSLVELTALDHIEGCQSSSQ
jgi:hypothetical protein